MTVAASSIKRMLINLTPEGEEAHGMELDEFDVELSIRGEEVGLVYAGPPKPPKKVKVVKPDNLTKLKKAELIAFIESL